MKVRLGNTDIGLGRYLGLWTAVVVVFAVQWFMRDALNGHTWSPFAYLRWSMIQWYTWAALAPLVFRLAVNIRSRVRCACAGWARNCRRAWV